MVTDLHADSGAIDTFVRSLFRYADPGTFISLRAFDQKRRDVPPVLIRPIAINGSYEITAKMAADAAEYCAQQAAPSVFAPPICTFTNPEHARGIDLANGLTLSVELDDVDPDAARAKLEGLIGPATMVVLSGSDWIDETTGEVKPKTHIHWRLSEPTRDHDDHEKLRQARTLASLLVGADPTAKPVVHPLRWPGSWNRKGRPRIATIAIHDEGAEINLTDALDALEGAVEAAGWAKAEMPVSGTPEAPIADLRSAVSYIPNLGTDVHYDEWVRLGYACHRATGGGQEGFDLWDSWSRISDKYEPRETETVWRRIAAALAGKAPPRTIGAGTIFYLAGLHGWTRPNPFASKSAGQQSASDDGEERTERQAGKKTGLPLVYFSAIEPNLDCADFVEGVLIDGGMSVVYGESNCGKTFFMTDLGVHIAMGKVWRGKEVELGGVIYCALEGSHGISNRIAAFRTHHSLGPLELPFAVIPVAINMLDPDADTPRLIEAIGEAATEMLVPIKLVVIDTLSRAMAGGNENAPDDMGALVTNTDKVRQATGAHVAFVHHSGKDAAKGARGHSLLRAATDTEIEVARDSKDSPSIARVTKQRELEIEGEFAFRLEVVELGKNRRGKAVTSCAVVAIDQQSGQSGQSGTKPMRVPPNAGVALRALHLAMEKKGAWLPEIAEYPAKTWAVCEEAWRGEFYQLNGANGDANRKGFQRGRDILSARTIITSRNGFVWLVRKN